MNNTLSTRSTREAVANMSDENLIQKYTVTRDRHFFSILYQRYNHLVFGACLKYLAKHEESRDLTMTIFEKLLLNPPEEEVKVFKSWLHKFIQYECFYYLRKHRNRGEVFEKFETFEKNTAEFSENEGMKELVDEKLPLKLEEAITKLPGNQRRCIELFYLKEKSYKEIVVATGFSEKEVKSFLQNGKRKLKILITGEMEG